MQDFSICELTIGYPSTCYGTRRVSHDLPLTEHRIRYRRVRRLPLHRLPWSPAYWTHRYDFLLRPAVDAVHLFNGVSVARFPWVSSIEMEYPRYFGKVSERAREEALECMASDHCRLLMPLSEAARRHLSGRLPDGLRDPISRKLVAFSGGVSIPREAENARQRHLQAAPACLTVGFVGRLFWHKGGAAVLAAVDRLRRRGADVRLLVVSELQRSGIMSDDHQDVEATRARLQALPWVEYHDALENAEVLKLMARCDVFAFPSLDESLGWVAIEAMGLGLPVITSNIFALPEIVEHGRCGFNIALPVDADGRWKGIVALNPAPRPSYEEALETLTEGCGHYLERFVQDPSLVRRMGQAARQTFEARYSERAAAARLADLLRTHLT